LRADLLWRFPQNKRAASQEAVTLPWLSAHSIRTGIGGDAYIVGRLTRLSRNFLPHCLFHSWKILFQKAPPIVDTVPNGVLFLLVLEAALLPAESASNTSKDNQVDHQETINRKWIRYSDN
jgi:hypothetical protein